MKEFKHVINDPMGLHARPATFFIQKANEYRCGIWVERDDRRVNAKSLLGVLSLGITKGSTIRPIADGSDEQLAIEGYTQHNYTATSATVRNSKGVELPSTGGNGTIWLIALGTMLTIAFAVFLITHKKMSVYTD